jgi:hypothetical protein
MARPSFFARGLKAYQVRFLCLPKPLKSMALLMTSTRSREEKISGTKMFMMFLSRVPIRSFRDRGQDLGAGIRRGRVRKEDCGKDIQLFLKVCLYLHIPDDHIFLPFSGCFFSSAGSFLLNAAFQQLHYIKKSYFS